MQGGHCSVDLYRGVTAGGICIGGSLHVCTVGLMLPAVPV